MQILFALRLPLCIGLDSCLHNTRCRLLQPSTVILGIPSLLLSSVSYAYLVFYYLFSAVPYFFISFPPSPRRIVPRESAAFLSNPQPSSSLVSPSVVKIQGDFSGLIRCVLGPSYPPVVGPANITESEPSTHQSFVKGS